MLDKVLPEDVLAMCPEAKIYESLVNQEKKIDQLISRHKFSMIEELRQGQNLKTEAKMLICISSKIFKVSESQMSQKLFSQLKIPGMTPPGDQDSNSDICWELKIEGKILEDENEKKSEKSSASNKKLSSFFKSLVIEVDKNVYGTENNIMEWHKDSSQELDGFQIHRFGAPQNIKIDILLEVDHTPTKYRLDPRLAELLGISVVTKSSFVASIWEYISANRLQDSKEPHKINLNEPLCAMLKMSSVSLNDLLPSFATLMHKLEAIHIQHFISALSSPEDIYKREPEKTFKEIEVGIESSYSEEIKKWLVSLKSKNDLDQIDSEISGHLESLRQIHLSHQFFSSFSSDPILFFRQWMISQQNDLKVFEDAIEDPQCILDDEGNSFPSDFLLKDELLSNSHYFKKPWIKEAVKHYISDLILSGNQGLSEFLSTRRK